MYTVRSNVAHGAKTPYGPDENQVKRDNEVLKICVPILKLIIEEFYGNPTKKFFVYGTLLPGGKNHQIMKEIDGVWEDFTTSGVLSKKDGLEYFNWDPKSIRSVKGKLFKSEDLSLHWDDIDRFEGSRYKRQIAYNQNENNIIVFSYYANNMA